MTILATLTLTVPAHAADNPIDKARANTHRCQKALGLAPSPVAKKAPQGKAYRAWVLALWKARADSYCRLARELGHPVAAIKAVFGKHANEALAVAECESGLSTRARNGQYLGLMQMGNYARSRYGHGDTPLEQARAAHAYFKDAGSDWSPWSCKPW